MLDKNFSYYESNSSATIWVSDPKGQLISKCLFGVFNSSKIPSGKFKFLPWPTGVEIFRSGLEELKTKQNVLSKLTDLYQNLFCDNNMYF